MPVCRSVAPAPDSRLALQSTPAGADDDEEALLARLIDLEQWLADDMARKPKTSKAVTAGTVARGDCPPA